MGGWANGVVWLGNLEDVAVNIRIVTPPPCSLRYHVLEEIRSIGPCVYYVWLLILKRCNSDNIRRSSDPCIAH